MDANEIGGDEEWRIILEEGIKSLNLTFKDICRVSMSCRRLHRLSGEDFLWRLLFSSDYPRDEVGVMSSTPLKTLYKSRDELQKFRLRFRDELLLRVSGMASNNNQRP